MKQSRLILLVLVLIFASLACNFGRSAAKVPPTPTIAVSTQAVGELVENVQAAATEAAKGGTVTLTFTEQQLTSLAVIELQSQTQAQQVNDLQIRLRDGQIQVSGQYTQDSLSLPFNVSLKISAVNGQPKTELVSAKIGPLPVPQSLLDDITQQIDQVVQDQMKANGSNVYVDQISVADGVLTVTGHVQ
jgi:hypothetical protein